MTTRAKIVLTEEGLASLAESAAQVAKYLTEEPYTTEGNARFRKIQGTIEITDWGLITSFYRPLRTKEQTWILHLYKLDKKKGLTCTAQSQLAGKDTELGQLIFRAVQDALKGKEGIPPLTWA